MTNRIRSFLTADDDNAEDSSGGLGGLDGLADASGEPLHREVRSKIRKS